MTKTKIYFIPNNWQYGAFFGLLVNGRPEFDIFLSK